MWGEINVFKIMRKIYVVKFFEYSDNKFNERNSDSDKKIINLYTDQLEKIRNMKYENTKIIFTPILSPIHLQKDLVSLIIF